MPNDDPGADEITSNTYVDVLDTSLDLLRGQHYQQIVSTLISGDAIWGAPRTQPSGSELNGTCPTEGSFSRTETYDESASGPNRSHRVELVLSACGINDATLTGTIVVDTQTESAGQGTVVNQAYQLDSVTHARSGILETIDATLTQSAGTFGFRQFYQLVFDTSEYRLETDGNLYEIFDTVYLQNFNREEDTDGSTMVHAFSESGSGVLRLTGQVTLRGSLSLDPEFVYLNESMESSANWRHTDNLASGQLEVSSIDGSKVRVSPDTGSDDTVNYLITSDGFQTLVEDFWFSPAASSQLP